MIKPLGKRVLIKLEKENKKTKSGIILANTETEKLTLARVIEIGTYNQITKNKNENQNENKNKNENENKKNEDISKQYGFSVKKDDLIIINKFNCDEITYENEEYIFINEEYIFRKNNIIKSKK